MSYIIFDKCIFDSRNLFSFLLIFSRTMAESSIFCIGFELFSSRKLEKVIFGIFLFVNVPEYREQKVALFELASVFNHVNAPNTGKSFFAKT